MMRTSTYVTEKDRTRPIESLPILQNAGGLFCSRRSQDLVVNALSNAELR